ncbi:nucleoside-diphosphate kinase [Fundicoccus culcitae]|uniref:nucleoside-diphosphate kinase n=1 Tax=Fundicoccus culcitae TaxID=2969821 RepID=A0ABY5P773_9LACT|nr:nucleoside-diphosphate kinase [Fundicoccus culcitae]UUX34584.1 nucleoside-diphosphate kinase [Fundicoccus culcitae]
MEETFAMLKPDAIERGLVGNIISRIENKGYKIIQMRTSHLTADLIKEHYQHHLGKAFYPKLEAFMMRDQVLFIHLSGPNCIEGMRLLAGATNPNEALPGSIRGDFAFDMTENLIHTSDSPETAQIELRRFALI